MTPGKIFHQGQRNNALFSASLRRARSTKTKAGLLSYGKTFNATCCRPPLSTAEVEKTVSSAWQYQQQGRNFAGQGGAAVLPSIIVEQVLAADALRGGDAIALWARLLHWHGARNGSFAVSPRAMAQDQKMPGWSEWRYRRTRDILLSQGVVKLVRRGGRKPGDPHLYEFV